MAYLAMRGCGTVNGVSRLHGEVSRKIFSVLFPRWPEREVPVNHVTNGVHVSTWDSDGADGLWTEVCGKGLWRGGLEDVGERLQRANDAALWKLRSEARKILVDYVRTRYQHQVAAQGWSEQGIEAAAKVLDPGVLTLGFARRFASYKRPTLLLHDKERLLRILFDQHRPVQLIVAGKAHPADHNGQEMIREWNQFIRQHGPLSNVVFLSDYDMLLTEQLVGGVDVWINTPRRPWEACGTSGMKVLVNGGLNVSELDGWWAEAYAPELGWALGDGKEHGDDPAWDAAEADRLYTLLEREIAPQFYDRDSNGIPTGWLAHIRASMSRLTPQFSANRAVREYTEQHYLPGAAAYVRRAADGGKLGKEIAAWEEKLAASWGKIHFGDFGVQRRDDGLHFKAGLYLRNLEPAMVRVEIFADSRDGSLPFRQEMTLGHQADGWGQYSTSIPPTRPVGDYTARVVPYHPEAPVPLECNHILWQK
jgi:starch phosphorylase